MFSRQAKEKTSGIEENMASETLSLVHDSEAYFKKRLFYWAFLILQPFRMVEDDPLTKMLIFSIPMLKVFIPATLRR